MQAKELWNRGAGDIGVEYPDAVMTPAQSDREQSGDQRLADAPFAGHDRNRVRDSRSAAKSAGGASSRLPVLVADRRDVPDRRAVSSAEDRFDAEPVGARALLDRLVFAHAAAAAPQAESAHDLRRERKLRDEFVDIRLRRNLHVDAGMASN